MAFSLHPSQEPMRAVLSPDRAPRHTVHFHDSDGSLVRVVASFLADGLLSGEAAMAIATPPHLRELRGALESQGVEVARAQREGRLLLLDAGEALARFLVGALPDASRFRALFDPIVASARAAAPAGSVRAYGEMVDLLWAQGNADGTLRLEQLWEELIRAQPISLLCGYRMGAFPSADHTATFRRICGAHSAVAPTERHASLPEGEQLARIAELEQRARALEEEIARRERVEADRARLFQAEHAARAEITLLHRVTDAANRAETLEQVYETALDGISLALGADRASVLLFDSDGVMRFKAWRGLSETYRAAVEGHSPWSATDRDPPPVLSEDVRVDPALASFQLALALEGIGALGFFPLSGGGRLLGKFMVYYPAAHAFTAAEVRLARAIADQIAFAVDRKLATAERERLLGIVGHDLRNPLNAIAMSASALLRRELPEADARTVRRIVTSADRMERLIGQLLQFAQARHGPGIPLDRAPADLGELARHVVEELEAAHPDRALAVEASGDLCGRWDAGRLSEVLSNLVGNAIQHGEGKVRVRVGESGAHVLVAVHNGGAPIPPAVLPHLFDPYRRGSVAAAARSHSVGLGLFISREIVRAHGGTIEVASSRADGTTFTVRLPRSA